MVYRHPFPGPGLGVRILGEVHKTSADILRKADHIFIEELRKADFYDEVSQAFAVFFTGEFCWSCRRSAAVCACDCFACG